MTGHHPTGPRLLDLGCGPSLLQSFCASRLYSDITLADYAEVNRQSVTQWWKKESGSFDWDEMSSYVAQLEKEG